MQKLPLARRKARNKMTMTYQQELLNEILASVRTFDTEIGSQTDYAEESGVDPKVIQSLRALAIGLSQTIDVINESMQ
jgi:hypothetical protein